MFFGLVIIALIVLAAFSINPFLGLLALAVLFAFARAVWRDRYGPLPRSPSAWPTANYQPLPLQPTTPETLGRDGLTRYLAERRAEEEQVRTEQEREEQAARDESMRTSANWAAACDRVLKAVGLVNADLSLNGMRLEEGGEMHSDTGAFGIKYRLRLRSCDAEIAIHATSKEIHIPPPRNLRSSYHFDYGDGMDIALDSSVESIADCIADVVRCVLEQA
jgi:hypothetical protein